MVRGSMFFIFLNFLRNKKNRAAERNSSAEPRLRNPRLKYILRPPFTLRRVIHTNHPSIHLSRNGGMDLSKEDSPFKKSERIHPSVRVNHPFKGPMKKDYCLMRVSQNVSIRWEMKFYDKNTC
jgi:hypothetical protein